MFNGSMVSQFGKDNILKCLILSRRLCSSTSLIFIEFRGLLPGREANPLTFI